MKSATQFSLKPYALIPAVLLAALTGPVAADSDSTPRERFDLFTDCSPMGLIVEGLGEDEKRIGLTRESLIAAAESRLRAARLFVPLDDANREPFLYVRVHVVGSAFSVLVYLEKYLFDRSSNRLGYAKTWTTGATGKHSGDGNYIVSTLQQYLDTFMAAYLRVNEEACR